MPSYCSLDIFSFKDSHLLFCHFNILKNLFYPVSRYPRFKQLRAKVTAKIYQIPFPSKSFANFFSNLL